jgi:hypothetical protein
VPERRPRTLVGSFLCAAGRQPLATAESLSADGYGAAGAAGGRQAPTTCPHCGRPLPADARPNRRPGEVWPIGHRTTSSGTGLRRLAYRLPIVWEGTVVDGELTTGRSPRRCPHFSGRSAIAPISGSLSSTSLCWPRRPSAAALARASRSVGAARPRHDPLKPAVRDVDRERSRRFDDGRQLEWEFERRGGRLVEGEDPRWYGVLALRSSCFGAIDTQIKIALT